MPIAVKGKTLVGWGRENWFTMVTKLVFPGGEHEEISFQYRGHFDSGDRHYSFVLQHSILGRVEGEGWVGLDSIVQRYWVLGDRQRRNGFETFYRLNDNTYSSSSGLIAVNYLTSTMEARLERQIDGSIPNV